MQRSGILFIISSPSGVGKTTVANAIIKNNKNIKRSISFTTRKKRGREIDGIDYLFISEEKFSSLKRENKMLEHAKVFTNYYGTSLEYINNTINSGTDVICCIDWQGAVQITNKMQAVKIFLLPPSMEELKNRLNKRGVDSKEVIENRLIVAKEEIKQFEIYDYVIINDKLGETIKIVNFIIASEREKLLQNKKAISNHIDNLLLE